MAHRPDVRRAVKKVRSTGVRVGVTENELMPRLDLVFNGYVSGLEGDADYPGSIGDQFSEGRPSFAAGLLFEVPLGNRAARARHHRRQLEMVQATHELESVVESGLTEVERAVRELDTSYREMLNRYDSMQATGEEMDYLRDRWNLLPGGSSTTQLLEDLLDAQERLADDEAAFVSAQVNYVSGHGRIATGDGNADADQLAELSVVAALSRTGRYARRRTHDRAGRIGTMTLLARRAGRRAGSNRPIDTVRVLSDLLRSYADHEIRDAVEELRDSAETPESTWTVRSAALVVEAFRRAQNIDLFDTQIHAGLALCDCPNYGSGYIAEMQTGEGKTFAAAFPAVAFALHGRGVHVATSNRYLAERDAELLRPTLELLDLTVGSLPEATAEGTPQDKAIAYQADITYGPGYEFGFDYLRDQLARRSSRKSRRFRDRFDLSTEQPTVQRSLFASVIDEVDHVLIDDASSPLVLAAAGADEADDAEAHRTARSLCLTMTADDFVVQHNMVVLTEAGRNRALDLLSDDLAAVLRRPWLDYVTQACHAESVFRNGAHYVIDGDKAQIVDPSTGRIFEDRTWSDGLHQAVEAKEGLPIRDNTRTLARITRQRFSGLYRRVCGMTGTAAGNEKEFRLIYGLDVEVIPTRLPSQRVIRPLKAYASSEERWAAIAEEVREINSQQRPVLVGTTTVSSSEVIASHLQSQNLRVNILNGVQDADEAAVIAEAGERGAVTVATGIAGRGTDIKLGEGVAALGGLHVVVAEAQPSIRVERQLVGRAARQGEPGSASRYVSADDPYIAGPAPWLADRMRRGHLNVDAAVRRVQQQTDQRATRSRIALWNRDRARDDLVARLVE